VEVGRGIAPDPPLTCANVDHRVWTENSSTARPASGPPPARRRRT